MGAWGITVRQSDDGLDLLDTIVVEHLRRVGFTAFNVSEAITLLNQSIQEEIERYKQKPPSEITDFYISESLMHGFTNAALLVAECLYDYYQTGELVVYDYIGENYDPVEYHIKNFIATGNDLPPLLAELESVQSPEHWKYQGWASEQILRQWLEHADSPDAPEWARDVSAAAHSEPEQPEAGAETPLTPETVPDPTGAGVPEQKEKTDTAAAEPDLTPNVDEYLNMKAQHPDKLVGVQVGGYTLFYGKDAEAAASAMDAKLLTREIPGLGSTFVTGTSLGWQSALVDLLEHGQSVVIARPDPERGPDAPYEIVKERDAADYIPIGMELTMDGRRMKIDSVAFDSGTVSLQDMDLKGWFPVFRVEPISFVRQFVEEVQRSEEHIAAEMADQLRRDEAAEEVVHETTGTSKEQVELDGGKVTAPRTPVTSKVVGRYNAGAFDVVVEKMHFGPEKHNFHITDDNLGVGGEKTKYQYNVTAIRTLKQIEAEGRLATQEEQETLSRYVGWGGIAKAFDPDDPKWAKEYAELKELLTPAEYESARSTVLNAHYARFVP